MTPANDLVARLRATRATMLGTDDEQHYWDCHKAADFIEYVFRSLPMLEEVMAALTATIAELETSQDDDKCEKS